MTAPDSSTPEEPESVTEGGEPVCLLHRVCPECGRLAEDETSTACPTCGAALRD